MIQSVKSKISLLKIQNKLNIKKIARVKSKNECLLIGGGPSLDRTKDLNIFLKKYDTFGCNHVWKHNGIKNHKFQYYALIDRTYAQNFSDEILNNAQTEYFITAYKCSSLLPFLALTSKKLKIFKTSPFDPNMTNKYLFNNDNLFTGNVMPFMIQIAMLIGYKKIILAGVDHYPSEASSKIKNKYFDGYLNAKNFKPIEPEKIKMITLFHNWLEQESKKIGCQIINISPGTHLTSYKTASL